MKKHRVEVYLFFKGSKNLFLSVLSFLLLITTVFSCYYLERVQPPNILEGRIIAVFLIFIVPVCEELFLRGYLLTIISDTITKIGGILVVSLVFSFLHFPQGLAIAAAMFSLSLVLCTITIISKKLVWAVVLHICWNTAAQIRNLPNDVFTNAVIVMVVLTVSALIVLGFQKRHG